jgi:hypothetical protein
MLKIQFKYQNFLFILYNIIFNLSNAYSPLISKLVLFFKTVHYEYG